MHGLAEVVGDVATPLWEKSIGERLSEVARDHPDNDAVVDVERRQRLSYAELILRVDELGKAMLAAGVVRGDRVGVWSTNRSESVLAELACARIGAILVGINPSYVEAELSYVLNQAGIRLVIAAEGYRTIDFGRMLASCNLSGWRGDYRILDTPQWHEFLHQGRTVDTLQYQSACCSVMPDDPFCLQYTSGTTGKPKGATITHRAALNNGRFIARAMAITDQDRLCVCLPFFHAFGIIACVLSCVTVGATVVVSSPTFDATPVLRAVESERCTVLHGVPTMFIAELNHPDFDSFDLSSLRTGLMGGAQCPLEVVTQVKTKMHLTDLTVGFGMSELASVTTQTSTVDSTERQVGSVGRVHPHLQAKVVDPRGLTVPINTPGELLVRGYTQMTGYWDEPTQTSEAIDEDGWLHSGDLATIDADGYVEIVGRLKDMIVRGGENIYPREIEDVLHTLDGIVDVHVVGVPDEKYGESVVAAVHVTAESGLDQDALRAHCRRHLAYYKMPQHFVFRSSFPTTASGKVRKNQLREQILAELEAEIPSGAALSTE